MKSKEKGITLIALVITIIVLLILAGVAVNTLVGENGIIKNTENTVETYNKNQIKEKIEMNILDAKLNKQRSSNLR